MTAEQIRAIPENLNQCEEDKNKVRDRIEFDLYEKPPLHGSLTLRGKQHYNPCVFAKTGWDDFYRNYPKDYDIRKDKKFNSVRSTYVSLGDMGFPIPEPTTSESLRTGAFGEDPSYPQRSLNPTVGKYNRRWPITRCLTDKLASRLGRVDSLGIILPKVKKGDMIEKSTNQIHYKWPYPCYQVPPKHTYEYQVHRFSKTDLHNYIPDEIVTFEDDIDIRKKVFETKMMKLKKVYGWPVNTITGEPLGGSLQCLEPDSCAEMTKLKKEIWPCKEDLDDINTRFGRRSIDIPRKKLSMFGRRNHSFYLHNEKRHYPGATNSYLDTRYPALNYECWEEVPSCCCKPNDLFDDKCYFEEVPVKIWSQKKC